MMVPAVAAQRIVKLQQQVFLLTREVHRRFDHDAAEQVARGAAADGLDALFALKLIGTSHERCAPSRSKIACSRTRTST